LACRFLRVHSSRWLPAYGLAERGEHDLGSGDSWLIGRHGF